MGIFKKYSDDLPKIGQILANAGFREFQDKSALDKKDSKY